MLNGKNQKLQNLRASLDNNMISILVLLDHSKAFNAVDHFILLRKPEKLLCFSETACRLLRSYLTVRSQISFYNGTYSESLDINRGVPQWFLLFCLYINDLLDHCICIYMYIYVGLVSTYRTYQYSTEIRKRTRRRIK